MKTTLLFLLLSFHCIYAQDAVYNFTVTDSLKLKHELEKAIGRDMEVRDFTLGDITADAKTDIIVIGSPQDREENRKIYLFICEGGNTFRLAAVNENIVECKVCGGMGVGDPYQRTVINKGYFSFELLYGACMKDLFTVTFKYDKKRKWWFLHKDVTESYNCQLEGDGGVKVTTEINKKEQYGKTRFENY